MLLRLLKNLKKQLKRTVTKEHDWIVVGKFGRPQGLQGLVRVFSFTQPLGNLYDYAPWHAEIAGHLKCLELLELKKNAKFGLVRVAGFASRELAEILTNVEILVAKNILPTLNEGEYYWHELVGMTVKNTSGVVLGEVRDMLATGANDVMIVEGEKERLIPYVYTEFVVKVDNDSNLITVKWDEDF